MSNLEYYLRDNDRQDVRQTSVMKGDVLPVSIDAAPWAEDNGAVTGATWSVESGNAAISGEALASNIASAVLTTSESGPSLIKVLLAGATHTKRFNLRVYAKDPEQRSNDYGFCHG